MLANNEHGLKTQLKITMSYIEQVKTCGRNWVLGEFRPAPGASRVSLRRPNKVLVIVAQHIVTSLLLTKMKTSVTNIEDENSVLKLAEIQIPGEHFISIHSFVLTIRNWCKCDTVHHLFVYPYHSPTQSSYFITTYCLPCWTLYIINLKLKQRDLKTLQLLWFYLKWKRLIIFCRTLLINVLLNKYLIYRFWMIVVDNKNFDKELMKTLCFWDTSNKIHTKTKVYSYFERYWFKLV